MKRFFIVFTVIIMAISAKGQSLETANEVQTWLNMHKSEIPNMTRNKFNSLSKSKQVAVWQMFTTEQKYSFWKEKLTEVNNLDWNKKELKHLKKLDSFLTHNKLKLFGTNSADSNGFLQTFMNKWTQEAKKKLNWTERLCAAIGCTLSPLQNKEGDIL